MENRRPLIPDYRDYEYGYTQAYDLAVAQLGATGDLRRQCRRCGARYRETASRQVITLRFLNRSYRITLPDMDIKLAGSREEVPLKTGVLLLHYFIQAKGTPLSGKPITFKELAEGTLYFPTFTKRTISPLLKYFGGEPQKLAEAGRELDGQPADYGDAAVVINVFPYVPLTFVIWGGDDEFDPAASIMFDAAIGDYLATEDIVVVCEAAVWTLVRALRSA
jgi:hypothetical protein